MNSAAFVAFLLDVLLKASVLLVLATGLSWLGPKVAAATKHLWLTAILCACLCLPLLTLLLPGWRVAWLPAPPAPIAPSATVTTPLAKISYTPGFDEFAFNAPSKSKPAAQPLPTLDWTWLIALLWAGGAGLVAIHLGLGTMRIWRLRRAAQPLISAAWQAFVQEAARALKLRRDVPLLVSQSAVMPMTTGIFQPVIILPVAAMQWSRTQLQSVLLHELAHIKRRDCLTQLLGTLASALYWCNPLVWVALRQLRTTRELACDDEVLATGTRASDYASCLVGVAQSVDVANYGSPLAVGMACSPLEERVRAILNPASKRRLLTRRFIVIIALILASLVFPLAGFQPFAQAPAPKPVEQQIREASQAEQKALADAKQQLERQRRRAEEQKQMTEVMAERLRTEALRDQELNMTEQQRLLELERERAEESLTAQAALQNQAQSKARQEIERAAQAERLLQQDLVRQVELEQELQKQLTEASSGEAMLRLQRAELDAELARLRTTYTEGHPAILEKRDQLNAQSQAVESFLATRDKSNVLAFLLMRQAELTAQLRTAQRRYTESAPEVLELRSHLQALSKEIERLRK